MLRYRRNDADRDRDDERAGHIEDGLGHIVDALQRIGSSLGESVGCQQLSHIEVGFQHCQQLQSGRPYGNGYGDLQKLPGGSLPPQRGIAAPGQLPVSRRLPGLQISRGDKAADGNAQNGTAGGIGHILRHPHDDHRSCQADEELKHRLQYLADGGGPHIALTLEETPVGGDNSHQQRTGAQDRNGRPGIGLPLECRQLAAEDHHQGGTKERLWF